MISNVIYSDLEKIINDDKQTEFDRDTAKKALQYIRELEERIKGLLLALSLGV